MLNLPFLSLLFLDLPLFFLSSQYQKVKWFIPFARSCYLIFQPVYHTTNPPSSYSFSTQPHSVYSSGLSLPAHHTALSEVNSVSDPLPPRNNPAIFRSSREDTCSPLFYPQKSFTNKGPIKVTNRFRKQSLLLTTALQENLTLVLQGPLRASLKVLNPNIIF